MLYSDIVTKIRNNETIPASEISGKQIIMLFQDNEIHKVKYENILYEFNLIPVTYAYECINIADDLSFDGCNELIKAFIKDYNHNKINYIQIEDEYFEIRIDVLETTE